ncbi:MAG: InlB B-repeat-containing protein [Gemmiger formicilis]|uniref:InlB B-repeat-containing protein n=1 Tax=Gemmiger formicilis TaxID=745368 RepID=UPI002E7973B1|nr:InlB B-repeat-containing protein [Gemmiger formicilis]MEE1511521.1 InlB B-repeat-containing protein [Gemmiger formicilis]
MLCLCVLCGIAVAGASAASPLPITFSTTGNVYQYAVKGKDPDTVTYGTKTSAAAAGSGTAALSGRSISVGLDTGDSKNFKLCYKEIPVTVTVPANTTYTVALKFELKGTYTRSNRKATAKASFQVVYLGDASAAEKTTVFYPYKTSGNTIKTTIGGSDANTNIVQITMDDATTVSRSATKSFDFVNTTGKTKDITKYFGVWIAGNYGKTYSNQATAKCTVTPASYLVTFDPNGGRVSPTSTAVTIGKKYGPLPTPNRYGYNFDGWYTEKIGGKDKEVTETDVVGTNPPTTLYAHWTAKKCLVALDANGGKIDTTSGQVNTKNYTATYGSKYNFLPTPIRTGGYNFDGWYTEKTGGTKVTSDTTVTTTKTHILYAHWSLTPAKAPTNVVLTMDKTSVYGAEFSRRVSSASTNDYTTTYTWYACDDEDGKNGKPLTDENGNPTDPKNPTAGTHYYYVMVTATRKDNGLQASTKSNVACITVTKATPTISTKPTAATLDLAKGNTLAASTLTGGTAKNNNARPSINVAGRFVWKDATVKPPLGWGQYAVVFQPNDTANYEPTETTVRVQVTCSHKFGAWSAGRRTCTVCGEVETRYNTVTITWGELAYTYTDGAWNPATHDYDIGGGWAPNRKDGDVITVQNEGANEVRVQFQYTQTNTAISGSFANSEGHGIYSAIEMPVSGTQTVRLCLTGRPDKALNNAKIGSVTVRLERGY